TIIHGLTDTVRRFGFYDVGEPLLTLSQRFVDEHSPIQVKAIKYVAVNRILARQSFDVLFAGTHQAVDDVLEHGFSILVKTDNLSVEQTIGGAERLFGIQQFRKLARDIVVIARAYPDFTILDNDHGPDAIPLQLMNPLRPRRRHI